MSFTENIIDYQAEDRGRHFQKASKLKRFFNSIIDTLLLYSSVILLILSTVSDSSNRGGLESRELVIVLLPWLLLVGFPGYYIFCEYNFGKTLGKYLTKTKVVALDGSKPTFQKVLIRTLCRLIPYEAISFLFYESGLHDRISKTMVVEDTPDNWHY